MGYMQILYNNLQVIAGVIILVQSAYQIFSEIPFYSWTEALFLAASPDPDRDEI
jgi:hypothetical protein